MCCIFLILCCILIIIMILLYRIHGVRGIARAIVTTLLGPTCSPGSRAGLKMRVSARTARGGGDWWVGVEEKVCEAGDPALATVQTGSLRVADTFMGCAAKVTRYM